MLEVLSMPVTYYFILCLWKKQIASAPNTAECVMIDLDSIVELHQYLYIGEMMYQNYIVYVFNLDENI